MNTDFNEEWKRERERGRKRKKEVEGEAEEDVGEEDHIPSTGNRKYKGPGAELCLGRNYCG